MTQKEVLHSECKLSEEVVTRTRCPKVKVIASTATIVTVVLNIINKKFTQVFSFRTRFQLRLIVESHRQ